MANITLGGNAATTVGSLPEVGTKAPDFKLTTTELSDKSLVDYSGSRLVLNIFPSVDTGVCAQSIRTFNQKASSLENTKVLCISKDLPFAMARFCGAEGLNNVESLSDYKSGEFGNTYGVTFKDSAFETLHSRSVVVLDTDGTILHTEQVSETGEEPNYEAALNALN
ncbi:lipid hydroperoxide peroxidase [Winogradskyella sp. PC-19]|uniref:thiol peroxidase n=1 Tax=unclassified Winogradskyella TaxID=2615021 RepID=UPI000B3CB81F|nr:MULTISPECIES: thiol peroxidase [unclassified Winogradskyella]ARV08390.1 lipid hydroperoxide peroxidase [Winogradskyella sp. PC-19]RZN74844.1 MAG: thiol peroxidase [Winogradskyella sp.]